MKRINGFPPISSVSLGNIQKRKGNIVKMSLPEKNYIVSSQMADMREIFRGSLELIFSSSEFLVLEIKQALRKGIEEIYT